MKQCYWNLAEMLHPTNYTRWFIFWCCYGNMLSSSPFLLKIKYVHVHCMLMYESYAGEKIATNDK